MCFKYIIGLWIGFGINKRRLGLFLEQIMLLKDIDQRILGNEYQLAEVFWLYTGFLGLNAAETCLEASTLSDNRNLS